MRSTKSVSRRKALRANRWYQEICSNHNCKSNFPSFYVLDGFRTSIDSRRGKSISYSALRCLSTIEFFDDRSSSGTVWRQYATKSSQYISNNDTVENPEQFTKSGQLELDFFGEPVTFVGLSSESQRKIISNAMAALDGFLLVVVSKGLSCNGGGDEGGIEVRSAHSSAISWAELLRYATVWNQNDTNGERSQLSAPMLAVVAVAPLLIQAGSAYVKHLDTLLKQTKQAARGLPPLQMYEMAEIAANCKEDKHLNPRERNHLKALYYLINDDHKTALAVYMTILRNCPGDALALSLMMDLCQTLGDKEAALR
jgi:hypothetical protein